MQFSIDFEENNDESYEEYMDENVHKKVEHLKKNVNFDDFFNFKQTKDIMLMDHRQQYNWTAGCQISDFYEYEHNFTSKKYSTLFRFDKNGLQGGGLASIVYKHIKKDYTMDIFHETPYLADSLVTHMKNNKKKVAKVFAPIKKRIFDWKTKTYI